MIELEDFRDNLERIQEGKDREAGIHVRWKSREERANGWRPDINNEVRVNIPPVQKAGLLTVDVLAGKDVDKAIPDRAIWRDDERRWCREGKLLKPGWWE